MKKKLGKYLLLSMALLAGYSQLYSYFSEFNTNKNTSSNNFKQTDKAYYNDAYVAKSSLCHFEKFNCEIEITDREDDEITSLKKHFTVSSFFCGVTISNKGYVINHPQKASVFNKLSNLISCKRYILLRAIRI